MAKTIGPLFSLAASGSIANLITYVCGHYAKKKQKKPTKEKSQPQEEIMTKWKDGCGVWQTSQENKDEWGEFLQLLRTDKECAVKLVYTASGFQLFMSFYMKDGPGGWPNYPHPPTGIYITYLLLESGGYLLTETGGRIIVEQ